MLKFLYLRLQDHLVLSFYVNFFVVFQEARLVLRLELTENRNLLLQLLLKVRDTGLRTPDPVKSALQDIDGVVEDLGEGPHGGLCSAVGFCLSPDFPDDLLVERSSEFALGLLIENVGQFFLGKESVLSAVVGLEHLKDTVQVV